MSQSRADLQHLPLPLLPQSRASVLESLTLQLEGTLVFSRNFQLPSGSKFWKTASDSELYHA
jgi:hypothetical protein